eukprot:CAMPEP_0182592798 /NCGR_PEP_ID=MMETSP1324-20130603/76656_1 /TAXON_ID=236786 /ORGANISM="Florenciella sp., Strain RCC1587" /LENGTH=113 /DNA_ID=CAMNT_0024810215 /DNA_START=200 /DNA_END=542 /DNA_ORIENTATION=+
MWHTPLVAGRTETAARVRGVRALPAPPPRLSSLSTRVKPADTPPPFELHRPERRQLEPRVGQYGILQRGGGGARCWSRHSIAEHGPCETYAPLGGAATGGRESRERSSVLVVQ